MLDFLQDNKKHTICLVGGGGKTTLLYELAEHFAAQGRRVLALTSTHILQPDVLVYAENAADARALWQRGSYAVIGTPEPASGWLTEAASDVKLDAELLACLLTDERGARKNVGSRAYYVILNKCDTITEELAQRVWTALLGKGLAAERIWLRGRKNKKA